MKTLILICLFFVSCTVGAQKIMDSCFTSAVSMFFFPPSPYLVGDDSDLLEWDGSEWNGQGTLANITLPPPGNISGSRAIFIGGDAWTTNGEGFALKLDAPIIEGQTYTYEFTYVSHGFGSDGNFTPDVYTNDNPNVAGANNIANLKPVDTVWTTNTFTFKAYAASDGHDWLIVHTNNFSSSGLIYRFCESLGPPTGINEQSDEADRYVVRVVDLLGRESEIEPNKVLIYIYNDGTRERVMRVEK